MGREREGELATTPLEFEYRHRKSRCKMLICGDDISNDVITLGTCFSVFVRHSEAKGFISNRRLYNRDKKSASKQATAVLIISGFAFTSF